MLARRELCTAQVVNKLKLKGFCDQEIEPIIKKLQQEGAINDERTALENARRFAHVKIYGRFRALKELKRIGIDQKQSEAAVAHVYNELDEQVLLNLALTRRLKGQIDSPKQCRRLFNYLLRQGFDRGMAISALKPLTSKAVDAWLMKE